MLQLPGLPRPKLPSLIEPLREMLGESQKRIAQAGADIRSLGSELRGTVEPPRRETRPPKSTGTRGTSKEIAEGTACNLCSDEHFHQVAGDLAEAMRFARDKGLRDPEVVRRISHAREELNEMERYDLSPSQIEKISGPEREIAEWSLPKSRNIRHLINAAIVSRNVDDLNKAAAEAERTATEFTDKVMGLPVAKECSPCGDLEDLKTFLEKRRKKGV